MIYDEKSMRPLAKKAGVDAVKFSRLFLPSLALPFFVIPFSPLAALISFLALLRAPHLFLWYFAKERRKKLRREIPLFTASLKWMLSVYPVQEALCSVRSGEMSGLLKEFCDRYRRGDSFEDAILSCAVFPEMKELARRLIVIYKTGAGIDLLDLYSGRIASENLSLIRNSAARMQIFAVAYTAIVAVFPAMYSGLSMFSGKGNVMPFAILAGLGLVILWKIID